MKPKHEKRIEAEARKTVWAALAPQLQLEKLQMLFPDGAKRQKERIKARIEGMIGPKKAPAEITVVEDRAARKAKARAKREELNMKRAARIKGRT